MRVCAKSLASTLKQSAGTPAKGQSAGVAAAAADAAAAAAEAEAALR